MYLEIYSVIFNLIYQCIYLYLFIKFLLTNSSKSVLCFLTKVKRNYGIILFLIADEQINAAVFENK